MAEEEAIGRDECMVGGAIDLALALGNHIYLDGITYDENVKHTSEGSILYIR